MSDATAPLTPELLIQAYGAGLFPMSEHRDDPEIFWVDPHFRGILPLDGIHVSRSLARRIRRGGYTVTLDSDFSGVLDACADRAETWINAEIRRLYVALHRMGRAHSLEIWQDGELAGGVYGVVLGSAFFGESMFSRRRDGSKLALVHLCDHLRSCGFTLFDTQFITPHLASMGAIEITRAAYRAHLRNALALPASILAQPLCSDRYSVLQRSTQTS
ncbi:leucyl/phenylalanyl-tRNA--protein transferase [Roseovarius halotolerans]|uniref:Leucyl/phenylalanyl-tRNA--protein transferase n=1 Tax=Roseovarius halotolerans TaxID=505353 RepID=A0A1X6YDQ8_9RHOB|nr:leucyl/phenylalanyl-tRNA--protein transferase [Roseovarius halotolerans]RKT34832.1 leucyl/phenylalanyl-tRNA--protein transferase [Roseovarius halotolerans]SLN18199.1 Leucyl/phenylalanyl-tRNA--protein transferase [Roseovarius halotolerans]